MDRHSPAIFLADCLGLDFLNSVATPVDVAIDWIDDGEGLLSWLKQAGLVAGDTLDEIKARAIPGELDKVADQARVLREWFRGFVRAHMGRPMTQRATTKALHELEPLNRLLECDETFGQIVPHGGGNGHHLELRTMRRWRSPESLLLPLGEAMAKFVCEESFEHVKACEGPSCTLMFADHTRRKDRRWCSMALCGNRAKQAAHRNRLKKKG